MRFFVRHFALCSLLLCIVPAVSYAQQQYTIKRGDYLYGIARTFHTSVDQLQRLNHLSSNDLQPGQIIVVSTASARKDTVAAKNGATTKAEKISHNVRSGDTLSGIADKYGVSVSDLKKMNGREFLILQKIFMKLIKDRVVEVNGKDMKITDFGRKYLKEIEKL